mgnify:CR=1 FL=1
MDNLAIYGKSFQDKLSFLILEDRVFADRLMEVLKVEFLEYIYQQWFVNTIFEYKKKYKIHPSRETIESIIKASLTKDNELIHRQVSEFYARMLTNPIDDHQFIKDKALDFARKQKLHEAMLKAVDLLKINSFDEIKTVINNALKAGSEIDSGHDYIKDFERRYVENVRSTIPLGLGKIDEIIDGGLGKGEYCILMGGTGVGKTALMVSIASQALKRGENVVFYTLELKPEVIGQRFDACITGVPIGELKQHKEEVLKKIADVPGQLRIKFYPKKTASLTTIRNHLERLKSENFNVGMIVLDYLELLKSVSFKKELRHEIGDTYDEFESIIQELNTVGITASQLNREGYSSQIVTMAHTSEAFNKNFGSYLTLGLSRDSQDKINNTGKISVCKNRNGPDGMVYNIFMDLANVNIKVLDLYNPGIDLPNMVDPEEEKRRLREKYKKFKEKNRI